MSIQGLRDSNNFGTDMRPKNWREGILLLNPNGQSPLIGLSSQMATRSVNDPEFNWWEKSLDDQRVAGDASITSSDTTISVSKDALTLKEGHLLWVKETGEIMMVSSDPSSDTSISVVRGFSGTSAQSFDPTTNSTDPNYYVIGTAHEEGSGAPTGINFDPVKKYNFTQIFRNTLEMTNTAARTRLRTTDAVREAKREALQFHGIEMEKAFWIGQRWEGSKNGKPIRTTRGVINWIPSSRTNDFNGNDVDLETLEGELLKIFEYGSSEKMAWCGNRALLTIQQIARKNSSLELVQNQREFGMNISRLISPFGELVLKTHPLFNQLGGDGTNYFGLNDWMVVLDMAEMKFVHLEGRDTKFEREVQDNGQDALKSGYITEAGIELHHPDTHYFIKGLRSAAQDA